MSYRVRGGSIEFRKHGFNCVLQSLAAENPRVEPLYSESGRSVITNFR